jgi:hypothetical protein
MKELEGVVCILKACEAAALINNNILKIIIIVIFLHGLGRLTRSGIDALPVRLCL